MKSVKTKIWNQVRNRVQFMEKVETRVSNLAWGRIGGQYGRLVSDQAGIMVETQVMFQVWSRVIGQVRYEIS